jgi:blue light- and temperature-responsive anti-repressor
MSMSGTMRRATTPGSLYRLIYRSREVISRVVPDAATGEGLQRELRTIVSSARWRNKADNVTGALLFTDTGFAQILEGPREVVERTFERIAADHRHVDVTVLSFTPTQRRSFPDWPMAFCGQSVLGPLDALGYLSDSGVFAGSRVTTGSDVLRLLERVVQQADVWMGA